MAFLSDTTASVQKLVRKIQGGPLLIVVLEEFSVRGFHVCKQGKDTLEIVRTMDISFDQTIDNRLKLAHLFKKWDTLPTAQIVVVTNDFVHTTAELPRPKYSGRFEKKQAQATLLSLAKFEIAPFLGYPAIQSMVTAYVPPIPKGEFDDYGIEDVTVNTMIFALHKKMYEQLKQVCTSVHLELLGVLPEQILSVLCNVGNPDLWTTPVNWQSRDTILAAMNAVDNDPSLLVTDIVPLQTRIVEHPLALPAFALLASLTLIGLDAAWLEYKIQDMKDRVAYVSEEKKVRDANVSRAQAIQKQYDQTKASIRQAKEQIALVDTGLIAKQYSLQAFFAGLFEATPPSIQLNSVHQFSDNMWTIEGLGQRYDIISWYVVELKNLPCVSQCRLEKANQINNVNQSRSHATAAGATGTLYAFTLQIMLEEE